MKKLLKSSAVLMLCASLTGCSEEKSAFESTTPVSSPKITKQADNTEEDLFPEYFTNLVNSYDNSAEKYDLNYKHPIKRISHKEKNSDIYSYSYNFGVQSRSDSSSETIEIKEKTDGTLIKSFQATFAEDYDTDTIRDFLLATIIMANPNIDFEQASSDTQNLINSYDGTGYSDIYKTDSYSILLNNQAYSIPCTALHVMYNEEVNTPVDIRSYSAGSFETISSPLNAGKSIYINVFIQSELKTDSIGHNTLDVLDELGNAFTVHLFYPDFCIEIDTAKEYTFYGVITKTSGLRLEYFEEVNE